VRWDRRKTAFTKRGIEAAPDLVFEVLSPSNRKHDRVRKRRFYARNGIPEYWIVDPEEHTIEVLERIDGGLSYRQAGWYASGDVARSTQFELAIDIDALFRSDDDD
jgi:Uma2 family endonuclease